MHIFKIRASVPQSNLIVIYKYFAIFISVFTLDVNAYNWMKA